MYVIILMVSVVFSMDFVVLFVMLKVSSLRVMVSSFVFSSVIICVENRWV